MKQVNIKFELTLKKKKCLKKEITILKKIVHRVLELENISDDQLNDCLKKKNIIKSLEREKLLNRNKLKKPNKCYFRMTLFSSVNSYQSINKRRMHSLQTLINAVERRHGRTPVRNDIGTEAITGFTNLFGAFLPSEYHVPMNPVANLNVWTDLQSYPKCQIWSHEKYNPVKYCEQLEVYNIYNRARGMVIYNPYLSLPLPQHERRFNHDERVSYVGPNNVIQTYNQSVPTNYRPIVTYDGDNSWRACYYKLGLTIASIHFKGVAENANRTTMPDTCHHVHIPTFTDKIRNRAMLYRDFRTGIIHITFHRDDINEHEDYLVTMLETGYRAYRPQINSLLTRAQAQNRHAVQAVVFHNQPHELQYCCFLIKKIQLFCCPKAKCKNRKRRCLLCAGGRISGSS